MTPTQADEITLAVMQNDIAYIKEKLNSVDLKVSSHYVSKEEFDPVKKIVYGMVTILLVAVLGALLNLVIR